MARKTRLEVATERLLMLEMQVKATAQGFADAGIPLSGLGEWISDPLIHAVVRDSMIMYNFSIAYDKRCGNGITDESAAEVIEFGKLLGLDLEMPID